jgi:putative membrane protein
VGDWTLDPLQLAPVALLAGFYAKRARTLKRRGQPVPAWRIWSFGIGLALVLVAVATPLEAYGEQTLFSAHMVQHILLGDLAPLAVVLGLTGPLLRPVLAVPALDRLRVLAHPLVALPLWTANLYLWHLAPFYEAALSNDAVHALQHFLFFSCGALMWAAVVEVLPGPEWFGTGWKLAYVVVVRAFETVLGNVFLWAGDPFYEPYREGGGALGVSPAADQGIAGALMMIEGSIVTIGVLAWLFLKLAAEGEQRQELLERGLDPRAVRRAVRYGRGDELAAALARERELASPH